MKNSRMVLGMILGATLTPVAFSQEGWLVLHRSGHYIVAKAVGNTLAAAQDVGDLISYAQSPQAFAVMSRQADDTSVLRILDKSTGQVTRSFPINARVVAHMSGPMDDMVLEADAVYFVTLRRSAQTQGTLNAKDGRLDLNRLTLADGTLKTFALPPECHTSRLVSYDGVPLIYAWNGYGVWEFDTSSGTLKRLPQAAQMSDIFASEEPVEHARVVAAAQKVVVGPFSDDVAVPSAGVFRLSKTGSLQKILDANLAQVGPGRPSMALGFDLSSDGQYAHLMSARFNGAPAIGALGTRNGSLVFEYIDANTLKVEWTTSLPAGTDALSLKPVPPDGIAYVDHDKTQIGEAYASTVANAANASKTSSGFKPVWNLASLDRSANPYNVRILTFEGAN